MVHIIKSVLPTMCVRPMLSHIWYHNSVPSYFK